MGKDKVTWKVVQKFRLELALKREGEKEVREYLITKKAIKVREAVRYGYGLGLGYGRLWRWG